MPQDKQDQQDRSLGLSTAQVMGSALAAMSGAFLASWLGTTGTLVGAAVASVIATVGAAIYTHSIRRTSQVVKRTAVVVSHRTLLTGAVPQPDPGVASDGPVPDPNAPSATDQAATDKRADEPPDHDDESAGRVSTYLSGARDLPWAKVSIATLAVLVAALGGITAVEAITGKPMASWFGRDDGTGTTVSHVGGSGNSTPKKDKAPDNTPASQQPEPSSGTSEEPQPTVPTTSSVPVPSTSSVPVPSTGPSDGASVPPVGSQAPTPAP